MSMIANIFDHQSNFMDSFSLTMYWQETALVVSANVHGLNYQELKVEIRDRSVFLIIRKGQSCGHCIKSCQLPQNVNIGKCKTAINNGVLTVTVPKVNKPNNVYPCMHGLPKKQNPPVISHFSRRPSRFFC